MKQLSKHQLNKMTASDIKEAVPFQLVSDGEVFAVVLPMKDYTKAIPESQMTAPVKIRFGELPLSKTKQARGELPKGFH